MFSKLLMVSGIFPPDPGGPAKFAREFAQWSSNNGVDVRVISYGDEPSGVLESSKIQLLRVSRKGNLIYRYLKMISAISESAKRETQIICVGAFLETYFASIFKKFNYVAKVPGDIVWERARNNKVTDLDINDFQQSELSPRYRIFRYLFTQSLKRASLVIVPSKGLLQLCISWGVP